jgi:LuxR family transcriptional activator of bioluminescence operon
LTEPKGFESIFTKLRHFVPFDYAACGIITVQSLRFEVIYNNYPVEFVRLYMTKGMETEPALYQLRHSTLPLATSEDIPDLQRPEVDAIKAMYGIHNCLSLAMRGQLGFSLYVAVSNFHADVKGKLLQGLCLIAPALQNCCTRIAIPWNIEWARAEEIARSLSDRETQVLNWTLEGKTNGEIATILQITERTVRFHLEEIFRKSSDTNPRRWDPRVRMAIAESLKLRGYDSVPPLAS